MFFILKKTITLLLILLLLPIAILCFHWHWQPQSLTAISPYLFLITNSAGSPYAIITSIVLFSLFCLLLPANTKRKFIVLWLILASCIASSVLIKDFFKTNFSEPRPFVLWIEKAYNIEHHYFYSLPKDDRKAIIQNQIANNPILPLWLTNHWQNEVNYSFPSGHTIFAATWAFLAILLLNFKKHSFIISVIIVWAVLIEISRLNLGMHNPYDLIFAVILAWLIANIGYFCAKKYLIVD